MLSEGYIYPVFIEQGSEGSFLVRFPDLPEALTFGHTLADALEQAVDCLSEALRGRIRDGEDIPSPSKNLAKAHLIAPPAEMTATAAVYNAFRRRHHPRFARSHAEGR